MPDTPIQPSLFEEDYLLRELGQVAHVPQVALTELVATVPSAVSRRWISSAATTAGATLQTTRRFTFGKGLDVSSMSMESRPSTPRAAMCGSGASVFSRARASALAEAEKTPLGRGGSLSRVRRGPARGESYDEMYRNAHPGARYGSISMLFYNSTTPAYQDLQCRRVTKPHKPHSRLGRYTKLHQTPSGHTLYPFVC